jgi:hypothetical protein
VEVNVISKSGKVTLPIMVKNIRLMILERRSI